VGQVPPVGFRNVDVEALRGGQDPLPRLVALRVADAFDLVETRDRVAHMSGVGQRLFAFRGEGEHPVVQCVFVRRAQAFVATGRVLAVRSGALRLPGLGDVAPGGFLLLVGGHDASLIHRPR
jgi:hypothetical protein